MEKQSSSAKTLVFPGQHLAVEEEFVGGLNTYADDQGNVAPVIMGEPEFNQSLREVHVTSKIAPVKPLEVGSVIWGKVALVKENAVIITLLHAEKDGEPRKFGGLNGTLMVSRVSREFVKDLGDYFRTGDLVKAKVMQLTAYAIELSTDAHDLGVIKGFCVKCRSPLHLFDNKLKCTSCGNNETRKVSSEYALRV
ncbi:MAG: exosome complex RNA-binding protein Csl4 [Candidatus Diapherotrites archaeon]|nr:exosome complex RNA-binding protein Csl4 [Candidatus Diapherotrites archaeon]